MLAAGCLAAWPGEALALRVTSKRVVFEGKKRADALVLINNSDEEQAYRLSLRSMRMTEDGSIVPVADGDAVADIQRADDMIKFAPRRVVMPPGGSQQVRLMFRRPESAAEGEYRSHFWIEPEHSAAAPEVPGESAQGTAVKISMLTGVSLPVIVRVGELAVAAAIVDGSLTRGADGSAQVQLTVTREGGRSLYGDMEFSCGGEVVHRVNGLAVYTEVARRRMAFKLRALPADCAAVDVVYRAVADDAQYQGGVMAQAVLAPR